MDELKGLKDIKDIVEIDTFNPIWLLVATLLILVAIFLFFYLKKRLKKRRRFKLTLKEEAMNRIKNINWEDEKSITYTFIEDVKEFINEKNRNKYEDIKAKLEEFKYKKEVPKMKESLKDEIKAFIKGIK